MLSPIGLLAAKHTRELGFTVNFHDAQDAVEGSLYGKRSYKFVQGGSESWNKKSQTFVKSNQICRLHTIIGSEMPAVLP